MDKFERWLQEKIDDLFEDNMSNYESSLKQNKFSENMKTHYIEFKPSSQLFANLYYKRITMN